MRDGSWLDAHSVTFFHSQYLKHPSRMAFFCKPCSASDPTQDTVKVNPDLMNKENVQPLQHEKAAEQKKREFELAEKQRKEEAAAAAVAEAARLREEVEREAAEKARRQEAAREAAEEAARREAVERAAERAREEQAAAEAKAAAAAAAAAVAAEEQRKREEAAEEAKRDAEEKVAEWCKKNGFQDMCAQKKTFRGATKFPMHTAVKYNNQEIIGMMLLAGAEKDVMDSKQQTPSQLAEKLNKDGSHDQVIAMLR